MGNHDLGSGEGCKMKKTFLLLLSLLCLPAFTGEFPIGIYALDPIGEGTYRAAANSGFNYVFYYVDILTAKERVSRLLDTSEKCGMKVALQVVRGKHILRDPEHLKKLRTAVREWKNHPALGMWYLFDEPSPELHERLLNIYKMLKTETPDIPVLLCLSWIKNYQVFKDCADILMPDLYPVKNQKFPDAPLNQFSHFVWDVKRLKKPVMPIAQIMSFVNYPKMVKVDPKSCGEPNAQELRYFSFSVMTMDVCGIAYYSFWDIWRQYRFKSYFLKEAKPVFLEVREFAMAVDGMKFECHSKKIGTGYPPKFFCSSWQKDGRSLIVFVNNTSKPVEGEFQLERTLPSGSLSPWGQTRSVKATNLGSRLVLERVAPWEVLIWSCGK